mmetsp:Transcript_15343/g.33702  ORF Transcript_15343/g.33702 Transcript_15343/m.33702 type:complete len:81 (-) Transcript_15343:291-533(-)
MELVIVREDNVIYSKDLFPQPISTPWMAPMSSSLHISPLDMAGVSASPLQHGTLDRISAKMPARELDMHVSMNGKGKVLP